MFQAPSPSDLPGLPDAARAHLAAGIRAELGPVREALDHLGRPDRAAPVVLIGGTNGKGSTATFLASALAAGGHRVGLFRTPSPDGFAEQMVVDGRAADAPTLERLVAEARAAGAPPLTAFEWATVLAFAWFREAGVAAMVVEVGLGGRDDATNSADPVVSVVTRVALDHEAQLGATVEAIARVKAAIGRAGRPLLTAARGPALEVLRAEAGALGARLEVLGEVGQVLGPWHAARLGWHRPLGRPVRLGLAGDHQRENAALALGALEALAPHGLNVSAAEAARGFEAAWLPGRLMRLAGDPDLWWDGAHNPDGASALADALGTVVGEPAALVVGAYRDKDLAGMMRMLLPHAASVHAVPLSGPRGLGAGEVAALVRGLAGHVPVVEAPSAADAVGALRAGGFTGPVVVCGSLGLGRQLARLDPRVLAV